MTTKEKEEWIEAFKKLPTGNISDAMDALGLPRGVVLGLRPLNAGQPATAGFAFTIQQTRRRKPVDGKSLAKQGDMIDSETQPGDIVVIDMAGITDVCTGGSILALRAQMRGVNGELTNGCLRDADEIGELSFPAYCAGTVPIKSALDIETIGVNVPVFVGDVKIHPGDFIVMDCTGVVVIPVEHLAAVLEKATKIARREEKMTELIRAGKSLAEARAAILPA